ncbi:hypothetical protein [Chelatococcus sp. XZ-Ab1]|uniref:hypothetical protein n=1 Tax=Chelatococcus sp. XZ-Ab1 TaxID=3034027 RepID=UPI0023E41EC4|nr:hypothetical protein [Chelatococcus sp. XZ-Ab1]
MTSWVIWAALLMAQNAAFTWVSRARNSGSIPYHAVAAVFSNGVWILSMFIVVDKLREAEGIAQIAAVATFYTVFTVAGSVAMHWFSMSYLEKGKRRVGA